jgi:hypothetical protein
MKQTITLSLVFIAPLFNSCLIESSTKYNGELLTAGKGIWNIDLLTITEMDPNCNCIYEDTTYYDYGTITFSGKNDNIQYEMENAIVFDTYTLGPISGSAEVFSADVVLHIGSGTGLSSSFIDAQFVKIERNELILFCPWSINTVTDGINDVDMYFKCTKK